MDGGPAGVIAAYSDSALYFWPVTMLRAAAEEVSRDVQDIDAPVEEWRVNPLDAVGAQEAMIALTRQQQLEILRQQQSHEEGGSADQEDSMLRRKKSFLSKPSIRGPGSRRGGPDWSIDFDDLVLDKVIGEGAFGTVYLGRCKLCSLPDCLSAFDCQILCLYTSF